MRGMRGERLAEGIHRELADILVNRVRDPRLGLATVTRVEVSSDGSHARILVSFLGDEPPGLAQVVRDPHGGPIRRHPDRNQTISVARHVVHLLVSRTTKRRFVMSYAAPGLPIGRYPEPVTRRQETAFGRPHRRHTSRSR